MTALRTAQAAGIAVVLGVCAGIAVRAQMEPGEIPAVGMPAVASGPRAGTWLGDGTRIELRPENAPPGVSVHTKDRLRLERALEFATVPGAPLLTVRQVCGEVYRFQTVADLPKETLPCRCKNPLCVVVLYTNL